MLGLLSLYRETGEAAVLERAVACGRHIPASPTGDDSDGGDWCGVAERPLAGFSHGAAGIAYALLRLHEATGVAAFLETARRGLDFERALFDPERRNWPDLREDDKVGFPVQWCHGAAGIGLARVAALHVLDTSEIRADIEAAISTTLVWPDSGRDHLCCGHAGRLSILGFTARTLGNTDLARTVDARMAGWLARAGGIEGFRLLGAAPSLRPSLMQGARRGRLDTVGKRRTRGSGDGSDVNVRLTFGRGVFLIGYNHKREGLGFFMIEETDMSKKNGGAVTDMMAAWRQSGGALEALPADAEALRSRRRQESADAGPSASMGSHNYPWCIEPDEGLSASMASNRFPHCIEPEEGLSASSPNINANPACLGPVDVSQAASR